MNDTDIKHFVRETLGCTCPDDVFDKIEYQETDNNLINKINIGDKLLIYIIQSNKNMPLSEQVLFNVKDGVKERKRHKFNRFRLVVFHQFPDDIEEELTNVFNQSEYKDDKTHLHILNIKNLFLR